MLTLRKIENVPTGQNNKPRMEVKITGEWPRKAHSRFRRLNQGSFVNTLHVSGLFVGSSLLLSPLPPLLFLILSA